MIVTYEDSHGYVTIDLPLRRIRVFFYDEVSEWNRRHLQDQTQVCGKIIDGKISEDEHSIINTATLLAMGTKIFQKPTEIHGYNMIKLCISDYNIQMQSVWNNDFNDGSPVISLAKILRKIVPIKRLK